MTTRTGYIVDNDDGGLGFSDYSNAPNDRLAHPFTALFHVCFRLGAVLVYLFCGWFSEGFIASFVVITLLLSADFWTVKNVSGRILVGLRWWNYVDPQGNSNWVFESRKEKQTNYRSSSVDSSVFWVALVLAPLLWFFFFFSTLISFNFKWFTIVLLGMLLSGANLYGYIRCRIGEKGGFTTVTANILKGEAFKKMLSGFSKSSQPPPSATFTQTV